MKFDLQRVIVCIIDVYMCVADVADKTSNFLSSILLCENIKHRSTFLINKVGESHKKSAKSFDSPPLRYGRDSNPSRLL